MPHLKGTNSATHFLLPFSLTCVYFGTNSASALGTQRQLETDSIKNIIVAKKAFCFPLNMNHMEVKLDKCVVVLKINSVKCISLK